MNTNRIKQFALPQIILGVVLLAPPAYYFLQVHSDMGSAAKAVEDSSVSVSNTLSKLGISLSSAGTFLKTASDKIQAFGDGVDKVPAMGSVATAARDLASCLGGGGTTLKDTGGTISSSVKTVQGLPRVLRSMRDSVAIMSLLGIIAAGVVIVNGLMLRQIIGSSR
jgi:hypothetical protein